MLCKFFKAMNKIWMEPNVMHVQSLDFYLCFMMGTQALISLKAAWASKHENKQDIYFLWMHLYIYLESRLDCTHQQLPFSFKTQQKLAYKPMVKHNWVHTCAYLTIQTIVHEPFDNWIKSGGKHHMITFHQVALGYITWNLKGDYLKRERTVLPFFQHVT